MGCGGGICNLGIPFLQVILIISLENISTCW